MVIFAIHKEGLQLGLLTDPGLLLERHDFHHLLDWGDGLDDLVLFDRYICSRDLRLILCVVGLGNQIREDGDV